MRRWQGSLTTSSSSGSSASSDWALRRSSSAQTPSNRAQSRLSSYTRRTNLYPISRAGWSRYCALLRPCPPEAEVEGSNPSGRVLRKPRCDAAFLFSGSPLTALDGLVAPGPGHVPTPTPAVGPEDVVPRPRPTAPATYALAAPALGEIAPLASVHLSAPRGSQRSGAPAFADIAVSPDSRFRPEHRDLSAGAKLSPGESVTEADAVPDLLGEGAGGGGIAGGAFASAPKGHAGPAVYAEQVDGGDPAYVLAPRAVVESLAERGSHPLKALDPRPQRNRLGSLLPATKRPEVDVVGLRASLDSFRRGGRCGDQAQRNESEADIGAPPHADKGRRDRGIVPVPR